MKNRRQVGQSFLAMVLASTVSLSQIAFASPLEDLEGWTHNSGVIESVDGNNILTITAGDSSTSNRIPVEASLADGATFSFKFFTDSSATLKAGFKLYEGGTSSSNEMARFKFDNGTLKHMNETTTLKDEDAIDSAKYTSLGSIKDNVWYTFTFHYYMDGDDMMTDIYMDGNLVNEAPLGNIKSMDNLEAISFITDSNTTGTFMVDEVQVIEGFTTPEVLVPQEETLVDPSKETEKPVVENIPALQAPVAYPEPNAYGAGLNGYELKAPSAPTNVIDVTEHGISPNTGKDVTEDVRALLASAEYGDALYFPNGTYDFITNDSVILTLKSGVSILGESQDGTIFKAKITDSAVSTTFLAGMAVQDMAVRNITFTSAFWGAYPDPVDKDALGVNEDQRGNYVYGVNLNYNTATGEASKQLEFTNLTFENYSKMGMRVANTQDVRIKGCTFQYTTDIGGGGAGYGVSIQGTVSTDTYGYDYDSMHNVVEECRFLGPYLRHGVLLQYYSHNNLIINNMLYGTGYGSIDLHGEDEYLNEIAYNEVYNCRWGGGIEIGNSGAGHDAAGPLNYVHNNYLQDGLRGIDVVLMTDDTIIENNEIHNMTYSGIMLKNAGRTWVANNILSGNASAFVLERDNGYSYFDVDDWAGGVPTENNLLQNTLRDNTKDYTVTAGEDNFLQDYTADAFTTDTSSDAYLHAISIANASLTRPFLPEMENYYLYTNEGALEMEIFSSAQAVESVKVNGEDFTGTVYLNEGENTLDIVVTAQDGVTTKTYTIHATRLGINDEIPSPVLSVSLQGTAPSIPAGRSYELQINVMPASASNREVVWELVSGEDVLTLDKGKVKTLQAGTATIKVSSVQNPEVYTEFDIEVLDALPNAPTLDDNAVALDMVTATASTSDVGKGPEYVLDGLTATVWAGLAGSADGAVTTPATLTIELAEETHVTHVDLSWVNGAIRKGVFKLYGSVDGKTWIEVYSGESSGMTTLPESYLVNGSDGMSLKYIQFEGLGNINNSTGNLTFWNSLSEVQVYGLPDGGTSGSTGDSSNESGDDKDDTTSGTRPSDSFTDVDASDWFSTFVDFVVEEGLMFGTSLTEFSPNLNTSRAMITTIIANISGEDTSSAVNKFTDVEDGAWYTQPIAWCAEKGIVTGFSAEIFGWNNDVTREQLLTILYGFAGYQGIDVSVENENVLVEFKDGDSVAEYAKVPMAWAVEQGLVAGIDGDIKPQDSATRVQVATILKAYMAL